MIINTGSRTDTVQYYSDWLLKRFEEGFVYSRNPMFQKKVTKYELDPKVLDCVVFCSKNYEPILDRLTEITSKFNTYFHYTITAYGKDVEPNVPSIDESINTLIKLSQIVGKQRIAWRYDPILLTEKYTIQVHLEQYGVLQSGCMTSDILGRANGITFKKVRHSGNRPGCRCMENRNIGDYDTCPNGCKYCYANQTPQIAQENYKKHNPNDLMILGNLKPTDEIQQSSQKSFLETNVQQKLF